MPTPKPTRSAAPSTLPIQYTPFTEKHFTTKEGIASFNQQMSQIVNALNRGTGQAGPVVIPAGVNVAGGSVTGLGTPSNESDAVPLGHANSQFGYAAQQGQLDIGKPYALKGLTGLWSKFNQLSASQASGGEITQYANLAGSRGFYATANPDTTPPASPYIYQNKSGGIMFVVATADGGGGGFHGRAYCDSSASPTTPVSEFSRVNAGSSSPNFYPGVCPFIVPPGFYYGISVTSGGGTPGSPRVWTEWVLAGASGGGGGGGGGGISQLTGDVQAGPGSGTVSSTVVRVNGGSIPISQINVGTNASGQIIAVPGTVTIGGTVLNPTTSVNIVVWYAPFDCTVTNVLGYVDGATGSVINARRNGTLTLLVSNLTLGVADVWIDGGAVQNTAVSTGDKLEIMVISVSGTPTQIAVEIQLTRP